MKLLVVYYSLDGNTKAAAERIAGDLGCDVCAVEPEKPIPDKGFKKFLWGGKAAFATVDVYRELMNWRRSLPKYVPKGDQQQVLDLMQKQGTVSVAEVRKLLGIKKGAADALLAKLHMQTRVVTGDIIRVYHGPDLHYSGWQRSSFCSPDDLFEDADFPFPGFKPAKSRPERTPAQSLEFLKKTVRDIFPDVPHPVLLKMLG